MALRKKIIPIDLAVRYTKNGPRYSAIDQATDLITTEAPTLSRAENVVVGKDDTFVKRSGFNSLPTTGLTPGTKIYSVDSFDGTLFIQTDSGNYVWVPNKAWWTRTSDMGPRCQAYKSDFIASSSATIVDSDSCLVGSLRAVVWAEMSAQYANSAQNSLGKRSAYLSIYDNTGEPILLAYLLSTNQETPRNVKVTVISQTLVLITWIDGGAGPVVGAYYDISTMTLSAHQILIGNLCSMYDVSANSTRVYVVGQEQENTAVWFNTGPVIKKYTPQNPVADWTVSGSNNAFGGFTTYIDTVEDLRVIYVTHTAVGADSYNPPQFNKMDQYRYEAVAGVELLYPQINPSTGVELVAGALQFVARPVVSAPDAGGNMYLFYAYGIDTDNNGPLSRHATSAAFSCVKIDDNGAVLENYPGYVNAQMISEPFYLDSYSRPAIMATRTITGELNPPKAKTTFYDPDYLSTSIVTCTGSTPDWISIHTFAMDEIVVDNPLHKHRVASALWVGFPDPGAYYSPSLARNKNYSGVIVEGGNTITFVYDVITNEQYDADIGGVYANDLPLPKSWTQKYSLKMYNMIIGPAYSKLVEMAGLGYRANGALICFDGHTEFLNSPERGPDMLVPDNQGTERYFVAHYSYRDIKGNIHRSPVSGEYKGSLKSIAVGLPKMFVQTPSKFDIERTPFGKVMIDIYWSLTSGGPYLFYDSADYKANIDASPALNSGDTMLTTYSFPVSTETPSGQPVYTTGNILAAEPTPPFASIATYQGRLFGIDSDKPWKIWYSKLHEDKVAAEFNNKLVIKLPDSSLKATAVFPVGNRMVIATEDELYWTAGDGPTNTGQGQNFAPPRRLSTDTGVTEEASVVEGDFGIFFRGRAGFYILTPSLQLKYIGRAIEDSLSNHVVLSSVLLPKQKEIRIAIDNGTTLIYNYRLGVWTTYVGGTITNGSATNWKDQYTFVSRSNNIVYVEDGSDNDDGLPIMQTAVATSWIKLSGAVQGYQRVRRVLLTGRHASGDLQVLIGFDYDETGASMEFHQWTEAEMIALRGPSGEFSVNIHLKHQKSEAIKIQFMTVDPFQANPKDYGTGAQVISLALEAGVKAGRFRTALENTK